MIEERWWLMDKVAERRNDGGSWIKSSGGSASQSTANMWTISHHKEIASCKKIEIKVE